MSDKYASDKEMQNLFEGFRRSLNEAPNVARNALVDDEGGRHYADDGMPTSDDVAQVIAQALQDPKMQSRIQQGAEGDIAIMIVQLFPIDSMDYSQAMRDGSGISTSAGQPYDEDGKQAAGQAETMMAKANEAIEGARYHQMLSDLGMDASIEQIIDLAKEKLIIAADGGADRLLKHNITPNVVIGTVSLLAVDLLPLYLNLYLTSASSSGIVFLPIVVLLSPNNP